MIFKCKVSGNTVEFKADHDIKAMLKHPQYEVVEPPVEVVKVEQPVKNKNLEH